MSTTSTTDDLRRLILDSEALFCDLEQATQILHDYTVEVDAGQRLDDQAEQIAWNQLPSPPLRR